MKKVNIIIFMNIMSRFKTMAQEYRTFKSKVVGLQFDKTVFDDNKVSQYIQDNKVKGGKPKLSYDGKFLGVKLGKGKQQSMDQFSVVPGKE